jgi:hypothetical protein
VSPPGNGRARLASGLQDDLGSPTQSTPPQPSYDDAQPFQVMACPSCALPFAEPNDECSARNWHQDDERDAREAPSPILKWWAANWNSGRQAPCIHCGRPSLLLDDAGRPSHKTCCQAALANLLPGGAS